VEYKYPAIDSDDLMSLVAAGDQHGYDLLYEKWSDALLAHFRCHTQDAMRSADLTQATFLRVWKQRQLWRSFKARGGAFRPWLYAIANNELINDYRSELRNAAAPGAQDPQLTLINVSGDTPTPEECLLGKEVRHPLRSCLSQLDAIEVQVLKLKIFDDNTLEQVGSVFWPGAARFTAITNANRTLRKALQKLKKCLLAKGIESSIELPLS